jgi:gamma-glutamyltranspeptidase/glutathione hydrolase
MSPTIVLDGAQPILTVGAAGGPTLITQGVQALVRRLDLGLSLADALAQPRIHHQWFPDAVRIESSLDPALQQALTSRGHKLTPVTNMGVSQGIIFDAATGQFIGAHDPRVPGRAAGP